MNTTTTEQPPQLTPEQGMHVNQTLAIMEGALKLAKTQLAGVALIGPDVSNTMWVVRVGALYLTHGDNGKTDLGGAAGATVYAEQTAKKLATRVVNGAEERGEAVLYLTALQQEVDALGTLIEKIRAGVKGRMPTE